MPLHPPVTKTAITQYETPATGATINIGSATEALLINPAGTIATLTVVLPTGVEGKVLTIASSQIVTALTVTGTIVGVLTTLALGGFARYVYSATAATWFRAG